MREFAAKCEFAHLIEHVKNEGYTKAVNTGLRHSRASYLVTLNSDTIVPKNWINALLNCINKDPETGIVSIDQSPTAQAFYNTVLVFAGLTLFGSLSYYVVVFLAEVSE